MCKWLFFVFLGCFVGGACDAGAGLFSQGPRVLDLRCENQELPLGIDARNPRLSWKLESPERGCRQTAYQVLVASSLKQAQAGTGDMWDSGKVESEQSVHVPYAGRPLTSRTRYYWTVCIWDETGRRTGYSEPVWFEMGLLDQKEWEGKWIGGGNLLRKEFTVTGAVGRARAYIAGVGYYELRLNGAKVGDHVLDPAWTDFAQTVLYATCDVTALLKSGANAVGVMLGNGRYSHYPYYFPPRVMFRLDVDYKDGTRAQVFSDDTWTTAAGPVVSNSVFNGEIYDARLEQPGWDSPGFSSAAWRGAQVMKSPTKKIEAQTIEPIKVIETIKPVRMTNPKPGVYVYDMGQNFPGWARLKVEGMAGTTVAMRFAENVKPDGSLDPRTNGDAKNTDIYTLKGGGREVWEPRFTYRGFRYVEVTGFPGEPGLENIEGRVAHNAVNRIGSLQTSNELINRLRANIIWGMRGNFSGVLTDCPQRAERCGWLEVGHNLADSLFYNFDMTRFYEKWFNDCRDAQSDERFPKGSIPTQIPYMGWACWPGDVGWSSFTIIAPWHLYQHTGDSESLRRHYPGLKLYMQSLVNEADGFIIDGPRQKSGVKYSPTLFGDWGDPDIGKNKTPKDLHGTAFFYYCASLMSRMATALNEEADAKQYAELAENIKRAFNARYLNPATSVYGTGSQYCYAMPLYLNLVPEGRQQAVLDNLVRNIVVDHKGNISIGEVGLPFMIRALTDHGRADVVYDMITKETPPGWMADLKKGFTTLPEFFGGGGSHNHIMFGTIEEWFYKALAGINVDPAQPGYKRVIIKPCILGDLKWVSASVQTVRGLVASGWERGDGTLTLNVTLPANSVAEVHLPKMGMGSVVVSEGGKTIWRGGAKAVGRPGIGAMRETADAVIVEAGSGAYRFVIGSDR